MIIVSENIYPSEIEKYTNNLKDIKLGILSSIPDKITQNKLIFIYESKKIQYEKFYNFLRKKISRIFQKFLILGVVKMNTKAPNKNFKK